MNPVKVGLVAFSCFVILKPANALDQSIIDSIVSKPQKFVCEINARPDENQSFMIFHIAGFNDLGMTRYRSTTVPPREIRVTLNGDILEHPNPCISEPIPLKLPHLD